MALTFGKVGLLGMHLQGYGCTAMSAVEYGLACVELEAGDSRACGFASFQGTLAMFAMHHCGSKEQKQAVAAPSWPKVKPSAASTSPSQTSVSTRPGCEPVLVATPGWVLDGTKTWVTNGSIADIAVVWARTDVGIQGFLVPTGTAGFTANKTTSKLSLRASVTSELVLQGVRLSWTGRAAWRAVSARAVVVPGPGAFRHRLRSTGCDP
jgi:glutaryl-CoA dehydrogenase